MQRDMKQHGMLRRHIRDLVFFCKRLTDIFWDYTNGPYAFFSDGSCPYLPNSCNTDFNILKVLRDGSCDYFAEEVLDNEDQEV